jgi:hypothetical protein
MRPRRRRSSQGRPEVGDIEEIEYPLPYDAAIVCVLTSRLSSMRLHRGKSSVELSKGRLDSFLGYILLLPVGTRVATGMFMEVSFVSASFEAVDRIHKELIPLSSLAPPEYHRCSTCLFKRPGQS